MILLILYTWITITTRDIYLCLMLLDITFIPLAFSPGYCNNSILLLFLVLRNPLTVSKSFPGAMAC